MVEFSVKGSSMAMGAAGTFTKRGGQKLLNKNGMGGNPSSLATKKALPNKKPRRRTFSQQQRTYDLTQFCQV